MLDIADPVEFGVLPDQVDEPPHPGDHEQAVERGDRIIAGYYHRSDIGIHRIFLNPDLNPRAASRTVWHELTHASQCEHCYAGDGDEFHAAAYAEALAAAAVGEPGPLERWARDFEDFDYDLRLVVMARATR